jgi:hypothetical protein
VTRGLQELAANGAPFGADAKSHTGNLTSIYLLAEAAEALFPAVVKSLDAVVSR